MASDEEEVKTLSTVKKPGVSSMQKQKALGEHKQLMLVTPRAYAEACMSPSDHNGSNHVKTV